MKQLVFLFLFLFSSMLNALDCVGEDSNISNAFDLSDIVFWGMAQEAKFKKTDGGDFVEYKFEVLKALRSQKVKYIKVTSPNFIGQKFQVGYQYIVFADSNGYVDPCNPSQELKEQWREEKHADRVDIPHALVKRVFGSNAKIP